MLFDAHSASMAFVMEKHFIVNMDCLQCAPSRTGVETLLIGLAAISARCSTESAGIINPAARRCRGRDQADNRH